MKPRRRMALVWLCDLFFVIKQNSLIVLEQSAAKERVRRSTVAC